MPFLGVPENFKGTPRENLLQVNLLLFISLILQCYSLPSPHVKTAYYTGKFSINEMCTTFPIVGSEVRNCMFPIPNFIPCYCKIFLCYVYAPSHGFLAPGKVFKVG